MSCTVVGTFASREAASAAAQTVLRVSQRPVPVQLHHGRLDTLDLPDSGTEVRRNMWIADGAGVLIGGLMGAVGAAYVPGLALAPLEGFVLGGVTGLFTAHITALMSGTRDARGELRALEDHLEAGGVIVSVEAGRRGEAEAIIELLEREGAELARRL